MEWFKQPGVQDQGEVSPLRAKLRPATHLESRRLSAQAFTYFLPYLPLALCPSLPDPMSEYAYSLNKDIDVVHWDVDKLLMPSLSKRGIDTNKVFGVELQFGWDFLNFANGFVIQDEAQKLIYRVYTQTFSLLEPSVSCSVPMEKLLGNQFQVSVLCLQSPEASWSVIPATPPTHFLVKKNTSGGDKNLWVLAKRFWRRGSGTSILVR